MGVSVRVLSAALTATTLVGCTPTVAGQAVKEPGGGAIVALLDTGDYAVTAGHPFGEAGDFGAHMEALRMAANVIGPWQVDSRFRNRPGVDGAAPTTAFPIGSAADLRAADVLDEPLPDIAGAHGLITGFSSTRVAADSGDASMNLVLRFPDADAATAAADEMATASHVGDEPRRPLEVVNYPEANASAYNSGSRVVAVSFTAHGPYVFYQQEQADTDHAAELMIGMILRDQEPKIDQFAPTDASKLAELPKDPTGQLLARTLSPPDKQIAGAFAGVWQPDAWLHNEDNPVSATTLFRDTGVEWVSQLLATVYQARDAAGAARIVDQFGTEMDKLAGVGPTPTGVPGFNGARCFVRTRGAALDSEPLSIKRISWHYKCVAQAGRYAFTAFSDTETDVKQQISAQYRILAGE